MPLAQVIVAESLAKRYNNADFSGVTVDGRVGCKTIEMRCLPSTEIPTLLISGDGTLEEIIGLMEYTCRKCQSNPNQ